jgi:hypothetical protein
VYFELQFLNGQEKEQFFSKERAINFGVVQIFLAGDSKFLSHFKHNRSMLK